MEDGTVSNYCQSIECQDCRSEELAESIVYGFTGTEHTATFDGYDGAPDARGKHSLIGFGKTQEAAKEDLLERCS
jgi:hypothetical protein